MTNFMQRSVLSVKLAPCPHCGTDKVKLTFDIGYGCIKGIYCAECKMFVKYNDLIAKKAGPEEWAERWATRHD